MAKKESAEKAVRDIRRKTRRRFSAEEKIRSTDFSIPCSVAAARFLWPPETPNRYRLSSVQLPGRLGRHPGDARSLGEARQ